MKKSMWPVFFLGISLMVGLSILYWKDVGEKVVTASTSINGQEIPICSVETEKKQIAYTFELAGEGKEEKVEELLQVLETLGVKGTFFLTGSWIQKHEALAEKIREQGCELQNLGKQGAGASNGTSGSYRKEIMEGKAEVERVSGTDALFFRIPYDRYDNAVLRTIYACGCYPIGWSIDSMDWKGYDAETIAEGIQEKMQPGAILRFHGDGEVTAKAVELLHQELQKEGYESVFLSEMIRLDHYQMNLHGQQQKKSK